MKAFHVGVAAEAFAAGLLAQAGCDVLVQYGANQPEYDLLATRNDLTLKISVKGSQDGGWGLIQGYKSKSVGYHDAADQWASNQSPFIVYCFVQFKGTQLGECPRVYLATVQEVVAWHKASRGGMGGTILWEDHCYARGTAANTTDSIPSEWRFSDARLTQLLGPPSGQLNSPVP